MEALSFEEFTKKIYIAAPLGRIYTSWATQAGICSWFLKEAAYHAPDGSRRGPEEPVQAGDRYAWKWHQFDGEETGTLLEADGKQHIAFSFTGDSRVRVSLKEGAGRVLVCLRQYNIPTDEKSKLMYHYGCSTGWTFWLANLKAWLEHGILLNDRGTDLLEDPRAGYEFVNI